ncbi:MAG TPA: bifunctional phosphoribosyl-AMP cyclohydrolase/phosphoribosyl-ATP diphosphatase HisIE [Methylomirabilota bacterium]|nr:bifunctional phosphoribosyl-AMP cyclohydrolase/phosphoribosyl-ATP diphosphatase HisIE [Methylomirabilota bacterium]
MDWLTDRRPAFDEGLLPVIVQDADDGTVLMLAWANVDALAATERTGEAHFWSRSRDRLWRKGETSGNVMRMVGRAADCDGDAILYQVRAVGAPCHTGTRTCFGELDAPGVLSELATLVGGRRDADPGSSYTAGLLTDGPRRPAEKVIEEAGEAAVAALAGSDEELAGEAADLLYHLIVLLASREVPLDRVLAVLRERRSA